MTAHEFWPAYICVALGGFWAIVYWRYSDSTKRSMDKLVRLKQSAEKPNASAKKILDYAHAGRQYRLRQFAKVASVLLITIAGWYWVQYTQEKYELSLLKGRLYPANDPMPAHACGHIDKDEVVIFLGSNIVVTRQFPHAILIVDGKSRLEVNRDDDGSIAISLDVLSDDGKVVARILNGQFTINQNNALDLTRKDRNSLEVVDQSGTQVLSMRYINPQVMWIDAVLHYPGINPIVISGSSGIQNQISQIRKNCLRGRGLSYEAD
jgi:hypothetical protein